MSSILLLILCLPSYHLAPPIQDEEYEVANLDPTDDFQAPKTYRPLGPWLWFDTEKKRLVLRAFVVKREGFLEHVLCLQYSKEHESILSTKATPRLIHAGLLLTGVEPGKPVQYQPEFEPPRGPEIALIAEWRDEEGKLHRDDLRSWVRSEKTGNLLQEQWVFAGSLTIEREGLDEPIYAADYGDLITVANFPEAILDLPIESTSNDAALGFGANPFTVPPLNTFVTLYLEPREGSDQTEKEVEGTKQP